MFEESSLYCFDARAKALVISATIIIAGSVMMWSKLIETFEAWNYIKYNKYYRVLLKKIVDSRNNIN